MSEEKVLSVWPDVDAYYNRFTGLWCVYRNSAPDKNIGEGVSLAEAWADAASKLPSAPSPAEETAAKCKCGHGRDGEFGHDVSGAGNCGGDHGTCPCTKYAPALPEPVSTEGAAEAFRAPLEPGWIATTLRRVRLETPMRDFVSRATDEQLERVNQFIAELVAPPSGQGEER